MWRCIHCRFNLSDFYRACQQQVNKVDRQESPQGWCWVSSVGQFPWWRQNLRAFRFANYGGGGGKQPVKQIKRWRAYCWWWKPLSGTQHELVWRHINSGGQKTTAAPPRRSLDPVINLGVLDARQRQPRRPGVSLSGWGCLLFSSE